MEEEKKDSPQSSITNKLIELLLNEYSINGSSENLEFKSTNDIVEEMSPIADVSKNEVAEALDKAGFKLEYTEAGIYWKMYNI